MIMEWLTDSDLELDFNGIELNPTPNEEASSSLIDEIRNLLMEIETEAPKEPEPVKSLEEYLFSDHNLEEYITNTGDILDGKEIEMPDNAILVEDSFNLGMVVQIMSSLVAFHSPKSNAIGLTEGYVCIARDEDYVVSGDKVSFTTSLLMSLKHIEQYLSKKIEVRVKGKSYDLESKELFTMFLGI